MSNHNAFVASAPQPTKILGIPLGDMGFFHSLLIACIFAVMAFFASCFLAIIGLLLYNEGGHHSVDMADAYLYVASPVGIVSLIIACGMLIGIWARRKASGR